MSHGLFLLSNYVGLILRIGFPLIMLPTETLKFTLGRYVPLTA